jgi:hypothetical protein
LVIGSALVLLGSIQAPLRSVQTLLGSILTWNTWQPPNVSQWERPSSAEVDALLSLERSMAIPSGVSSFFPLIFLGVAGLAWIFAVLKGRYLLDQATPDFPGSEDVASKSLSRNWMIGRARLLPSPARNRQAAGTDSKPAKPDEFTWDLLVTRHKQFYNALQTRTLWLSHIPATVVIALDLYFLCPLIVRLTKPAESLVFEWVFGTVYFALFMIMSLSLLRLILLGLKLRELLQLTARLPLNQALGRIPLSVTRWFYTLPAPADGRFEMIWRQAQALADRTNGDAKSLERELAAGYQIKKSEKELVEIASSLKNTTSEDLGSLIKRIRPILEEYWRSRPVTEAYGEAPSPSSGKSAGTGEYQGLRDIAMAIATKQLATDQPTRQLPGWIQATEDLLALLLMRRLSAWLAQLWILIGFLVVGTLCLFLAVNSYPFPIQGHLLSYLCVLVVGIVLVVGFVLLEVNRDPVISRVANSIPNRLKLDQNLVMNLVTYIIPLLGALAAISFDVSDTLRTFLEPIIKYVQ